MSNSYFQFKQFIIHQDRCAMKVTTDACLFGAWVAGKTGSPELGVRSILDVGTGTGLLALMLAQKNSATLIDSIEIDKDTFEQASENVASSPWPGRINVFHADARKIEYPKQYDVIISNPPFYENEWKGDNARKNIAHHNEGLMLPDLLTIIKRNLKPGGIFFLLLPYKRNDEIRKLFIENDLIIHRLTFVRQSTRHDFFRIMLAGKQKTAEAVETLIEEISIKDGTDQYTADFIKLLEDYYLYL